MIMVEAEVQGPGTRRLLQADAAMCAVILALGLFLAGTGNGLAQHWRSSSARQQSLGFEDQLGIVANAAGLIVTVWWVMSLAIAVAAAVLERRGWSRAASAAGAFAPAFMRRLALAAVGLQLLTAQLATAAVPPVPDAPTAPPALSAAWAPPAAPAQAPPADADPRWKVSSPVVEPGLLAGGGLRSRDPAEEGTEVTVRAGDSLWSLAAARLGPFASDVDVAREWPRLYQANREVIGGSPHLLQPGMVLRFPSGG